MASDELTLRVLIEIRDQIAGTNKRLDATNERLDRSVERLDKIEGRLDHHDQLLGAIGKEIVAVHTVLKDVALLVNRRLA